MPSPLSLLPFLAPLAMLAAAGFASLHPHAPRRVQAITESCALAALVAALLSAAVLVIGGSQASPLVGVAGIGLSVRIDALSVAMLLIVAFIGFIVLRFSRRYLAGDPGQPRFAGGLALTLAAVMLLVTAGNVIQLLGAWIATSLALHRLLVFYPERPLAQLAARKKFIVARLGDIALAASIALIVSRFGTTDIGAIAGAAKALAPGEGGGALTSAAGLLALAAMLKSAQFPSHGWLPEVVETPTPVSALLHAGIINAGGFLVLRFADVMLLVPPALHALALVGGFTALFASAVMLTQPAIKVQLAWSTIAQMGFMLFQCGIGAFSIALLHIVAHALYKAHAFLSSGSAVALLRGSAAAEQPLPRHHALGPLLAVAALAVLVAIGGPLRGALEPASLTLAGIFGLGLLLLLVPALRSAHPAAGILVALGVALAAGLAYALLHAAADRLFLAALPAAALGGTLSGIILLLAFASFALLALLQLAAPLWIGTRLGRAARIHLSNGLYVNALADRWLAPRAQPALLS